MAGGAAEAGDELFALRQRLGRLAAGPLPQERHGGRSLQCLLLQATARANPLVGGKLKHRHPVVPVEAAGSASQRAKKSAGRLAAIFVRSPPPNRPLSPSVAVLMTGQAAERQKQLARLPRPTASASILALSLCRSFLASFASFCSISLRLFRRQAQEPGGDRRGFLRRDAKCGIRREWSWRPAPDRLRPPSPSSCQATRSATRADIARQPIQSRSGHRFASHVVLMARGTAQSGGELPAALEGR